MNALGYAREKARKAKDESDRYKREQNAKKDKQSQLMACTLKSIKPSIMCFEEDGWRVTVSEPTFRAILKKDDKFVEVLVNKCGWGAQIYYKCRRYSTGDLIADGTDVVVDSWKPEGFAKVFGEWMGGFTGA
jgi:hypothetical protein